MTRVQILSSGLLWLALLPATAGLAADRPNILWITAEDMSPTLGCYGDAYAHTPNIDGLSKQSVRYTQAFATAPVCSPARSCLITGCYATSLGTQRLRSTFPIPEFIVGFPSLLRKEGYYCTNNVKTDYNTSNEKDIIETSWDDCSATAHWRNREPGRPFFCVFNDMTSHQSRTMVWPYAEFQKQVQSQLAQKTIHDPEAAPVPPYYPDTPLVRKTVARYYDCVSVMDKNVGRLLQQLEEDGLAEDTIVFFYSDHGSGMPRHKRALLDSGMHVPLLIRFPEKYRHLAPAKAGATVDRLVSFVDFAPTVLSLCGLSIPDYTQGFPFLGPSQGQPRRYVFGARDRVDEVLDLARSVRSQRYLYIRNYMPHLAYHQPSAWPDQSEFRRHMTQYYRANRESLSSPQRHYAVATRAVEELYDVEADPQNLTNLAESSAHRQTLQTMRGELRHWMLETRDLGFLTEQDAWQRAKRLTPIQYARDPQQNPLERLLKAASLVGGDGSALEPLQENLQDDESAIRYWAAVGLVALGGRASPAKSQLTGALQDSSAAVRIEAANALMRLGEIEEALPILIASLESEDLNAVMHAVRTIELLGEKARSAAPAVRQTLDRAQGGSYQNEFIQFSGEAFLKEMQDQAQ